MTAWKPPIRGVIHITGMPDSGKTSFATSVPGVLPDDIVFFDFDGKSSGLAKELAEAKSPFYYYENTLETMKGFKPLEVFEEVDEKIQALMKKRSHISVVVFDNWAPTMEEALRAKGMSILSEISDITPGQAKAISQITWPATKRYYAQWLQTVAEWADMVFIITHTKAYQIGQTKVPGVFEAKGQDVLIQLPVFRIWTLASQKNGGAPDGLVLKRISKRVVTSKGLEVINVLPPKISPCTWSKIIEYMENPVGERKLTPEETPSPAEAVWVGGEYLPDQKEAIMAAMAIARANPEPSEEASMEVAYKDVPLTNFVKAQASQNKTPMEIFNAAKEAGFTVEGLPTIIQLMQ